MWKVNPPTRTARESYTTCISRVRNAALKHRFLQVEEIVVTAAEGYAVAASANGLHLLEQTDGVGNVVSTDEMSGIYTRRMVPSGSPGREIYDELISAAPHGRCPLCGHRIVSTLDHHLPKSHYPALAVAPENLIPSCTDCNKDKLDCLPGTAEEETIHPYFDDIQDELWLVAEVVEGAPASIRFFVNSPLTWSETLRERVANHFKIVRLARLYTSLAAEELSNIRQYCQYVFDMGGSVVLREHLNERAYSAEVVRLNGWQTATYRALASSAWYYTGGFALKG